MRSKKSRGKAVNHVEMVVCERAYTSQIDSIMKYDTIIAQQTGRCLCLHKKLQEASIAPIKNAMNINNRAVCRFYIYII